MTAATLECVTKTYGRTRALDGLSFEVPTGAVCGLIGPNGSGKTTTMGVLAGLLRSQSGVVSVLGDGPFDVRRHGGRVGLMPQDSTPSQYASILESLRYYAELQGYTPRKARKEAEQWLDRVQLGARAKSRFGTLSHGMRRRFSVAQAMLGQPDLVLLDEPTSGLDPELVVEIRQLIVRLRGKSTVLVSSHILSELESMCDYAIFLEHGRCVRQGPMQTITSSDSIVRYRLDKQPDVSRLATSLPGCEVSWADSTLVVKAPPQRTVTDVNAVCLRALLDSGVGVVDVTVGDSLESAYLEVRRES